jgi:cell division protein FtsI (penicillin-binding protein 3)
MSETPAFTPGRWLKVRLALATGLLGSAFALLSYRAWVLQVREAEHLKQMAEDQYLQDVELPPTRGRILDRHGAELAASAEVDSVHVNGRAIVAADRVAETSRALADALRLDRREVEKKLRVRRYFTWVKRRVTSDEARAVRELALPGVYLDREPRRYYPNRALAGPLLGWAGLDAKGQEGLELSFDRWLRGTRAQVPALRDALGRNLLIGGLGDVSDVAGHDLYTTIDRYVQFRVEKALQEGVAAHRAKAGVAVALDPKTGEVLAMASVPTLNPNEPEDGRERGVRNRAVTDPFEPGSTMKTFSITAAIEAGVVHPDDHWFCENGRYQIGPHFIHDAERIGEATTVEVLAKSSNICTAKIAARQGRERLHEMLLRFGFGRPTGVELPGERAGNVRSVDKMGPIETATMSFGQGLTATPLQVAAGYAAIANDGVWMKPHVFRRIADPNGETVKEAQMESRRILSPELARTMRSMLIAVTQKGGTAEKLSIPGYSFAGKTGTAQKVDPVTRHYSTDKWASSFVGFAPASDPRLVLFVMIDEPQGTHYGSMVAGPVFQDVMIDALRWLGVPPDAPLPVAKGNANEGAIAHANPSAAPKGPADGRVAGGLERVPEQAPQSGAQLGSSQGSNDDDDTEQDSFVSAADDPRSLARSTVPDFTGMSIGEALEAARRAGLRVEVLGSGLATGQSPGPGEARRGAACRVVFTPPG